MSAADEMIEECIEEEEQLTEIIEEGIDINESDESDDSDDDDDDDDDSDDDDGSDDSDAFEHTNTSSVSYTEEPSRAPVELVGEFLGAVMAQNYERAQILAGQVLLHEPHNTMVKEFQAVIAEKIQLDAEASESEESEHEDIEEEEEENEEVVEEITGESESMEVNENKDDEGVDNNEDEDDEESEDEGAPELHAPSGVTDRAPTDIDAIKRSITVSKVSPSLGL